MDSELKRVFELGFRQLNSASAEYRIADALVLGANGQYFHGNTRNLYAFFVLGLECGKVVARPGFKLVEVPVEPEDLV